LVCERRQCFAGNPLFQLCWGNWICLFNRVNSLCERPCRRAPAFARSRCGAEVRRSRRNFNERVNPMAED
jgi:hypothetical protein